MSPAVAEAGKDRYSEVGEPGNCRPTLALGYHDGMVLLCYFHTSTAISPK